jgi:hypothetical protein
MHLYKKHRKAMQRALLLFLALLLATLGTLTANDSKALASVPPGQVTHVFLNLNDSGSQSQSDQYQRLLVSLRQAASQGNAYYRSDVYRTQHASGGVIRLSLHINSNSREISLWINPQNLYVLGFTAADGATTYLFPDQNQETITNIPNLSFRNLPFRSDYLSLERAAGRNLDAIGRPNYGSVLNAIEQLASTNSLNVSSRETPQALQLLIQFSSEAARFDRVSSIFGSIMRGQSPFNAIDATTVGLERSWGQISNYGQAVTQNPRTPGITAGGVRYNSWRGIHSGGVLSCVSGSGWTRRIRVWLPVVCVDVRSLMVCPIPVA